MTSLVLEVQAAAMDDKVSLAAVLRKAKVLSFKLQVTSINDWLEKETGGYPNHIQIDELPDYRVLIGRPVYFNPYNGVCPLVSDDPKMQAVMSYAELRDSVASIESNLETGKNSFHVPYPHELAHRFQQQIMGMTPSVQISRGALVAVLEGVRNIVLDWAMELEAKGVLGEGMTFSDTDRARAAMATKTTINNVTNIQGDVNNSQLQQASDNSAQAQSNVDIDFEKVGWVVDKIEEDVSKFAIDDEEVIVELNGKLDTVRENLRTPKPDFEIIAPALRSIKNILEGVAGSTLATKYATEINAVLSSLSVPL